MDNPTAELILTAIREYIEEKGFPPSIRNIQDLARISSTSKVQRHLDKLEEQGYIQRTQETARSIVLKEPARSP